MKYILLGTISLLSNQFAFSQVGTGKQDNIILQELKREFVFVIGNNEHPVNIREESSYNYYCNYYRVDVPIAEFYNNMERIDEVATAVDGYKKYRIEHNYDFYEVDGIFYSDARVCHFELPLPRKESVSNVTFRKTTLDPKYFTSIHFMKQYPVSSEEVIIRVPSWMTIEIKEFNFAGYDIRKSIKTEGGQTVYHYVVKNLPAFSSESSSQGYTYYSPHLMVLSKFANVAQGRQTYFSTVKDQYDWYRKLVLEIGNDILLIKENALQITKDAKNDEEKVKLIFQWVQDNIRYIAFEEGIAGFKPAKAQDVLNKRYGDCKGMANLLVEMLRAIGLDARRCWLGTRHLVYDYSTPSLAVDNHMIAVWMNETKPIYLDATEKYIGFGELAERIQGRQTLIEDGANYIIDRVPVRDERQNTSFEKRKLTIDGANLTGSVIQSWKGESKVELLTGINRIKQEKRDVVLNRFLSNGKVSYVVEALEIENMADYNKDLNVRYNVTWKAAVAKFSDDLYLELDNRRQFEKFKIDTSIRKLPYWFDFKKHLVFETELSVPVNKQITVLPLPVLIERPGYRFSAEYAVNGSVLNYRCEIALLQPELNPALFLQWNKDVEQLKEFYNQQIVLTTRK